MAARSVNFHFLKQHDPVLESLGAQAERYFEDDPNTALIKLRQFGEKLAIHVAEALDVEILEEDDFHGLLEKLWDTGALPRVVAGDFHALRREGNRAVHEHRGTAPEAAEQLKNARNLAVWFHQHVYGDEDFEPSPFALPGGDAPTRRVGGKKRAVAPAKTKARAAAQTKKTSAVKKATPAKTDAAAKKKKQAAAKKKKEAAAKKKKQAAAKKKKEAAAKKKRAQTQRDAAVKKKKQAAAKKKKTQAAAGKTKAGAARKKTGPSQRRSAANRGNTGKKTPARKSTGKKRAPAKSARGGGDKKGIAGWASAVASWLRG